MGAQIITIIFHADEAPLYMCDRLDFDYHSFDPGQNCTTISWSYAERTCTPVTYTLQAFELGALTSRQYTSPTLSLDSCTPEFSFPTDAFRDRDQDLHFTVKAVNAGGAICNPNGLTGFISFTIGNSKSYGIIFWMDNIIVINNKCTKFIIIALGGGRGRNCNATAALRAIIWPDAVQLFFQIALQPM